MADLKTEVTSANVKKTVGGLGQSFSKVLVPVVCGVVSVGLLAGVILPSLKGIKDLREQKVKVETELKKYQDKNQKLGKLKSSEKLLDQDLLAVRRALPDEEKIPELMTEVQMIADEVGTGVATLQYGGKAGAKTTTTTKTTTATAADKKTATDKKTTEVAVEKVEPASAVKLQLGVDGSYPQFQTLFKQIETASRMILVDQLSITENKEASLSAVLGLSSFFSAPATEQKVETPITLDLNAKKLTEILEKVKALNYYEVKVEEMEAGSENPFGGL